jgi:phage/plasmid primase-like uncharacterized protein/prophage antirepressor-like protein
VNNILYEKLRELGIPDPLEEVISTKVTRWGKNKRYWAVQFTGGYALGDWTSGLKDFAFEEGFDHKKCRRQIEEAQRKLTKERNSGYVEAAIIAQRLWDSASECVMHPYLETKKIKSHGLKVDRQTLLIPLYDENGSLTSVQKIWPDSKNPGKFIKGFLKGSRLQGNCFTIGNIADQVVICEGYATGATIHEITELPVVVAFSSNNLLKIAHRVVKNHPRTGVIVAADNDRFKPGNPGLTKAKEVAAAVKARLVVPKFASDEGEPTDFNDLYLTEGQEKVRNAFLTNEYNQQCVEVTQKADIKGVSQTYTPFTQGRVTNVHPLSNELQVFFYDQKSVRTLQTEGKTLWIVKDVCDAFGETNYRRAIQLLDKDVKGVSQIDTPGGRQNMAVVNEVGLYSLLFAMQPSKARGVTEEYIAERQKKLNQFKRWVTHDILPQIRKHGSYVTPEARKTTLSPPENVQYLTQNPCETAQNEETKEKELWCSPILGPL